MIYDMVKYLFSVSSSLVVGSTRMIKITSSVVKKVS